MGEERYWIVHGLVSTRIHPDADGHPSQHSRYRRYALRSGAGRDMDDLVARITVEARARGKVALFRDDWPSTDWGDEAARLRVEAGRLADDFRPRPLPAE